MTLRASRVQRPSQTVEVACQAIAENSVEMTERLFAEAGSGSGMRVLDVGCGRGDVSILAARMVGSSGEVIGLDRAPKPLAMARERAIEEGIRNLQFVQGDLGEGLAGLKGFDAVVGRRVLMYLPDRPAALRILAEALRPGGIAVLQETDATMVPASIVSLPLHEQVLGWIWETNASFIGDMAFGAWAHKPA